MFDQDGLGFDPGNVNGPQQPNPWHELLDALGLAIAVGLLVRRYRRSDHQARVHFWRWMVAGALSTLALWIGLDHHWPGPILAVLFFGGLWLCPIAALYTLHPAKSDQR